MSSSENALDKPVEPVRRSLSPGVASTYRTRGTIAVPVPIADYRSLSPVTATSTSPVPEECLKSCLERTSTFISAQSSSFKSEYKTGKESGKPEESTNGTDGNKAILKGKVPSGSSESSANPQGSKTVQFGNRKLPSANLHESVKIEQPKRQHPSAESVKIVKPTNQLPSAELAKTEKPKGIHLPTGNRPNLPSEALKIEVSSVETRKELKTVYASDRRSRSQKTEVSTGGVTELMTVRSRGDRSPSIEYSRSEVTACDQVLSSYSLDLSISDITGAQSRDRHLCPSSEGLRSESSTKVKAQIKLDKTSPAVSVNYSSRNVIPLSVDDLGVIGHDTDSVCFSTSPSQTKTADSSKPKLSTKTEQSKSDLSFSTDSTVANMTTIVIGPFTRLPTSETKTVKCDGCPSSADSAILKVTETETKTTPTASRSSSANSVRPKVPTTEINVVPTVDDYSPSSSSKSSTSGQARAVNLQTDVVRRYRSTEVLTAETAPTKVSQLKTPSPCQQRSLSSEDMRTGIIEPVRTPKFLKVCGSVLKFCASVGKTAVIAILDKALPDNETPKLEFLNDKTAELNLQSGDLSKFNFEKGTFGITGKVTYQVNGGVYAVKKLVEDVDQKTLEKEVQVMIDCSHKNLVEVFGWYRSSDLTLNIVMEFHDRGNLEEFLKNRNGNLLPEKQLTKLFLQVALAIEYLHSKRVFHTNLKPTNVLVAGYNHLKVADLGIPRLFGQRVRPEVTHYLAPEVLVGGSTFLYSYKSDVWALGCVLADMTTLRGHYVKFQEDWRRDLHLLVSSVYSGPVRDIIAMCIHVNSWDRAHAMHVANSCQSHLATLY